MTTYFINVADLPANDGTGRTYREVNNATHHAIPVGALVELDGGGRAFVVRHTRDCDGTPLYSLSLLGKVDHGYGEDSLTVIR